MTYIPKASEIQAEAGTSNNVLLTPLRAAQSPVSTAQHVAIRQKQNIVHRSKGDLAVIKMHDGVVSGGITINETDDSIVFDGEVGTKLSLGFPEYLRATVGRDIEIMVRFRSTSVADGMVFAMRRAAVSTEKGYSLNLRGNGRLRVFIGDTVNHIDVSTVGANNQFNDGNFQTVFFNINRTNSTLNVVDALGTVLYSGDITTIGDADTSAIATAPFTFAVARDGDSGAKAIEISTLRAWDRILTTAERLAEVASVGTSVTIDGLMGQYSGKDFEGTAALPTKVLDKGYNIIALPKGGNGQVLTVDDTEEEGVRWGSAGYPTITVAQDGTGDYNGSTFATVITALEAVKTAGGGEVFVKRGTYTVGDLSGLGENAVLHDFSGGENITLRGEGFSTIFDASTRRISAPTGKGIFRISSGKNIVVRDIYFVGDQSDDIAENQQNKTPTFLSVVGCQDVWLQNLKFLDGLNAFVVSSASENINIDNIAVLNCEHAYMIQGDGTNNVNISNIIHRKFARDSRDGYVQTFGKYQNDIRNINTVNCIGVGQVREGMRVSGGNGLNFSNISMYHETDTEESQGLFHIRGGKNINIENVTGVNNKRMFMFYPFVSDIEDVNINNVGAHNVAEVCNFADLSEGTTVVRNITVSNVKGTFQDGDRYGVGIRYPLASNITFRDCKLFNVAGATAGRAVRIDVDTYDVNFFNCQFSGESADFQKAEGVEFGGAIENCRFTNNNIVGETGGFTNSNYKFKSFKGNWHGTDETTPSFYLDLADISTGTAAPATTPTKVGDTFIDTTNGNIYIAKGTASSADWVQVNN